MSALVATGLARAYGKHQVFSGLDLAIEPGEVVAIRGASGTGKSTLLHLLGLLDTPDAGTITLGGEPATGISIDRRARLRAARIGFVFQAFHLLPDFNVIENVVMAARAARLDLTAATKRAAELLAQVGINDPRQSVATLSGGERQRVALCRALLNQPSLLLADEPTGNLDPETGQQAIALLTGLARSGRSAVVLVTHDPAVAAHADRRLELKQGRLQPA